MNTSLSVTYAVQLCFCIGLNALLPGHTAPLFVPHMATSGLSRQFGSSVKHGECFRTVCRQQHSLSPPTPPKAYALGRFGAKPIPAHSHHSHQNGLQGAVVIRLQKLKLAPSNHFAHHPLKVELHLQKDRFSLATQRPEAYAPGSVATKPIPPHRQAKASTVDLTRFRLNVMAAPKAIPPQGATSQSSWALFLPGRIFSPPLVSWPQHKSPEGTP